MSTKKVLIQRRIEQVKDGTEYKGHAIMGGVKLDYDLKFELPISQWDDMNPIEEIEGIRRFYQITLKKNSETIQLSSDEYGFFFRLLIDFAVGFYNQSQTRQSNDGPLGDLLRGKGKIAAFGAKMAISFSDTLACDLPVSLCDLLSAPKFGCELSK